MPEDFERRVRQKIEEISRSQEIKNIKRDFGNIARDVKKSFLLIREIIQGNSSSGNSRKASSVTTSVLISMGHRRKIMHPIHRQSVDTRQSVSPASCSPSLAAWD